MGSTFWFLWDVSGGDTYWIHEWDARFESMRVVSRAGDPSWRVTVGGGHKILSGFKAAGKRGFWFTQWGGVGEISAPWLGSHSPMTPDEAGVDG